MAFLQFLRPSLWTCTILLSQTLAQAIAPSNSSSDLLPYDSSARFLLNGTELGSMAAIQLAPLPPYAQGISKADFEQIDQSGQLINLDSSNINSLRVNQFGYLSCDPEAYAGYLNASMTFDIAFNSGNSFVIILYSETANHCSLEGVNMGNAGAVDAVLTTVDPAAARMLANLNLNANSQGTCTIFPDLGSFTNGTGATGWDGGPILGPSPTTAVAMIILYSITGLITSLFVVIIITGAVRAHRHPERYGPRVVIGRGRQSRAKGIARAMLETLPIVKFGDRDLPAKPAEGHTASSTAGDLEMNATATESEQQTATDVAAKDLSSTPATNPPTTAPAETTDSESTHSHSGSAGATGANADGTQDDGSLGCSICTEDFTRGEEVRVLPCNHKFHPECVDPWLLNVSGTCPLCRIDLRPKEEQVAGAGEAATGEHAVLPPPLEGAAAGASVGAVAGRRETVAGLRTFVSGASTREERIAALRRFREERRPRGAAAAAGEAGAAEIERRGVRDRLRTRFRVRTTRDEGGRNQSVSTSE